MQGFAYTRDRAIKSGSWSGQGSQAQAKSGVAQVGLPFPFGMVKPTVIGQGGSRK